MQDVFERLEFDVPKSLCPSLVEVREWSVKTLPSIKSWHEQWFANYVRFAPEHLRDLPTTRLENEYRDALLTKIKDLKRDWVLSRKVEGYNPRMSMKE